MELVICTNARRPCGGFMPKGDEEIGKAMPIKPWVNQKAPRRDDPRSAIAPRRASVFWVFILPSPDVLER